MDGKLGGSGAEGRMGKEILESSGEWTAGPHHNSALEMASRRCPPRKEAMSSQFSSYHGNHSIK